MTQHLLLLEAVPAAALAALQQASLERPVVVFKHSPICPTSTRALGEFKRFLADLAPAAELAVAHVDVIAQRGLARGLTAALGIDHQSPQALWFDRGELVWHASHGSLTRTAFAERLA